MEIARKEITDQTIDSETYFASRRVKSLISLAKKLQTDPEAKSRRETSLCPMCCYEQSRLGGASMTSTRCGICAAEMTFGSTNVDILCLNCARAKQLCKHCGADVDLKSRRKKRFPD